LSHQSCPYPATPPLCSPHGSVSSAIPACEERGSRQVRYVPVFTSRRRCPGMLVHLGTHSEALALYQV
jgi:hypothetical protein